MPPPFRVGQESLDTLEIGGFTPVNLITEKLQCVQKVYRLNYRQKRGFIVLDISCDKDIRSTLHSRNHLNRIFKNTII